MSIGSVLQAWQTTEFETTNWQIDVVRVTKSMTLATDAVHWFRAGWPIGEVAKALDATVPTLRAAFVAHFGVPPQQWLIDAGIRRSVEERVKVAEHLIMTSDQTLSEISQAAGFGTQQGLTAGFYKVHGIGPTKWKAVRKLE